MIFIGGFNLNTFQQLEIFKDCMQSWSQQTKKVDLVVSLYLKSQYQEEIDNINNLYPSLTIYFSKTPLFILQHYQSILNQHLFHDIEWIGFTELGIWEKHRIESFYKCLEGYSKFSTEQQPLVKYFRISRSIYTESRLPNSLNNESINKLLEEGKIIGNDQDSWGQLVEYCIDKSLVISILKDLKNITLIEQPNGDRYFLKLLNNQQHKFIQLNMNQIPISFWMFFYPRNTPNCYFKPLSDNSQYDDLLDKIKKQSFFENNQKYIYQIGTEVSTSFGPGVIQDISKSQPTKYKINIKWEESISEVKELLLKDILKTDSDKIRVSLYQFMINLINNIDLYLIHFKFDIENPPLFKHFLESISLFLKDKKESQETSNVMEKLFMILDNQNNLPNQSIYDNNLSRNIFDFVVLQPKFKEIIKL